MPSLTPEDRDALLGPLGTCARCGGSRLRHYCRSCDMFFEVCDCEATHDEQREHDGHRLYVWTAAGVQAIPNFD